MFRRIFAESRGAGDGPGTSHLLKLIAAFAAVYVIWGSTYLAIRWLIDTLPGFVMVGLRFFVAGVVLVAWAALRGAPRPTWPQLRTASITGVLLLFLGTGAVVWAAAHMDSGLLALLVAMEPLWLTLLLWSVPQLRKPGTDVRPTGRTFAALGLGFAGATILAAPGDVLGPGSVYLPGVLALAIGSLSWAAGSLYSRTSPLPESTSMTSGLQMVAGGTALLLFGVGRGEMATFDPSAVSMTSFLAFVYLITFGSLVAFSAYSWLIRTTDPTLVSTHTYVNPMVAIFLGWWLANETVGPRTLLAAALIVGSVVLMTADSARRSKKVRDEDTTPPAVLSCEAKSAA
ncbi:MAG: EamA family transporter [Acidobacteriota bacterium]